MVTIDKIKQIREETGVSVAECKKALEETKVDVNTAKEILRKWGKTLAGKKAEREVKAGIVESYIHPNKKVGVILDIRCESDFVARNEEFRKLAHEICLQIAALKPSFVREEDIPEEILEKEKEIYQEQSKGADKPKQIIVQIIEGKLKKYKEEVSLFSQPWIRDETKTIKDLVEEYIGKLGENIIIEKFNRYEI